MHRPDLRLLQEVAVASRTVGTAGHHVGNGRPKIMGMEKFEAGTHTVRVQDGSGGPAALELSSESSEPRRECVERSAIGLLCFWGAQSWFAKNTACRSPAPPRQAAGVVLVSCSGSVTRSHLCWWLGAAGAFST